MKKTFIFGLVVAAVGFSACSNEDDIVVKNTKKGMVLRAEVVQSETRATIDDAADTWKFAFATDDEIKVTNSQVSSYYTFANDGTDFSSADAQTTSTDATWYAYYPSEDISLVGQSGALEDVANLYALAGKTAADTKGDDGLTITMSPKVAILKIVNSKGSIDINVKTSATTWVKGMTATSDQDAFDVTNETTKQTLLSATAYGTYYIAVPAGVQLSVKDGDATVKSTGVSGLVAGKYYEVSVNDPYNGHAYVDLGLPSGLKWATMNVGATTPEDYGDYFAWGDPEPYYTDGHSQDNPCSSWKTGKTGYNWESYKWCNGSYNTLTKYCTSSSYGTVDSKTTLESADDAATKNWGGSWRMPTEAELEELRTNCTWTWTTQNGVSGYKVSSMTNGNSLFLPAAGCCVDSGLVFEGSDGCYWSSSLGTSNSKDACYLYFLPFNVVWGGSDRYIGRSVRAVCP